MFYLYAKRKIALRADPSDVNETALRAERCWRRLLRYYQLLSLSVMSENFLHKYIQGVEESIAKSLERALTDKERNSLRNCGSGMMLEVVDQDIYMSKSKEEMEQTLYEACALFDKRFTDTLADIDNIYFRTFGRTLTEEERVKIMSLPNLLAIDDYIRP